MTYYDGGGGSCGHNVETDGEDSVALSAQLLGGLSNNNPLCGKQVTIKFRGKTYTAVVKDKCVGCKFGDVDATRALFAKFGETGEGRLPGIEWWFS
ncbi:hypothetical protein ACJ73_06820 [Blastomyces percursus]|uniref:RlpA-like protein double-psi beta-barrel domain-containing protein n=1 Tax=Blastomyces percursus TaxID=1658174 RepID=A0A1J9PZU8_9EURO|nr:hypothetical protein ACJ73_06820 [Blastomyces percursus]